MLFLKDNGIQRNARNIPISIRAFVLDTPAKSFTCATKGHNSRNGCHKCTIEGVFEKNRMCFPQTNFTMRTNTEFRARAYEDYVKADTSVLEKLPIDMINQFLLDPLHLIFLGVVKKIMHLWMSKGPLRCRLSKHMADVVNRNIVVAEKSQPKEFNRRVRTLKYLGNFKGTEFRTFLLYIGPVVMKDVLPDAYYQHFITLHCAIRILADSCLFIKLNEIANDMLYDYVRKFSNLYGRQFISYNVHNLLHISRDCVMYGPLDRMSAFPFESHMKIILRMIRKGNQPLQQVANRMVELMKSDSVKTYVNKHSDFLSIKLKKPLNFTNKYGSFEFKSFTIDRSERNKWIMINSRIISFNHIKLINNEYFVYGKELRNKQDFFNLPIRSSYLNIFQSKPLYFKQKSYLLNSNFFKMYAVKLKNHFIFFPLIQ